MLPETLVRDYRHLHQAALPDYIGSLNRWANDPRTTAKEKGPVQPTRKFLLPRRKVEE